MSFKKLLIFIVVVGLVVFEAYLIASSIIDKSNQQKDIQDFCATQCKYNPNNFYYEFHGDNATKGFTTKDECLSYCAKARMGFVYLLTQNAAAFLTNIFDRLNIRY
jgi:hypothetical protein